MSGIDDLNLDEVDKIVIKYDQVYKPNKSVCPDRTFSSYAEMMEAIGDELNKASDEAYAKDIPFTPYTVDHKIKPEFAHEIIDSGVNENSD